jgi:hypothetical protein
LKRTPSNGSGALDLPIEHRVSADADQRHPERERSSPRSRAPLRASRAST